MILDLLGDDGALRPAVQHNLADRLFARPANDSHTELFVTLEFEGL